jgi:hypothetical protein
LASNPDELQKEDRMENYLRMLLVSCALVVVAVAPANASSQSNAVDLEPGSVGGSVRDAAGLPLGGATVILQPTDRQVLTSDDGSFEIGGLAAGSYRLEARAVGYAIEVIEPVLVRAGEVTEVALDLVAVPTPLDEIVVTAGYSLLRDQPISVVELDREEILELPHFGDDLYRAVAVLPGTSGNDFSAQFTVRGGLHDEILVRLDGLELFEPFHLKDFDGVFNILDPEVIGGVDLIPGSFPAEYGDRMSGVLDMTTSRPWEGRVNAGVSFSNLWAGGAGTFADDKGRWLGSARRGYLDLILSFVGEDQGRDGDDDDEFSPRYWDLFGKVDYDLSPSHSLSFKVLVADDTLTIDEVEGAEVTDAETGYGNATLGLSHLAFFGSRTVIETILSASIVDDDRWVSWREYDEHFALLDDRKLDVLDLQQKWSVDVSDGHFLKTGFQVRSYEADYDYFNDIEDADFIDDPRFPPPSRSTLFVGDTSADLYSFWVADRMRVGKRLTAEVGARYDEQSHTDENQVSPRLNLVYDLGRQRALRAGWGYFYQSQRPDELDVEFSETEFYPAQRAEHLNLGFEREWSKGYRLRLDAYRREVSDPHPRYETLFNPFNPIPEIEPDLIRIAPTRVLADGVEVFLKGPGGKKLDWWMSYALSSIEDEIEGARQLRSIDQTHAITANANYRVNSKWNLNWLWVFHTGWPTTEVSGRPVQTPEGFYRIGYTIGPFYEERFSNYHRLDLRASRTTQIGKGRLTLFVDIQNLYDRENLRGLEIDDWRWQQQPDGSLAAAFLEESWFGIMPSFGVSWER